MRMTDFAMVAVPAGGELVVPVLQGASEVKRHLERIIFTFNAALAQYAVVGYIDQRRIVNLDTNFHNTRDPFIEIDFDLPTGSTFAIGYRDLGGGAAPAMEIGYQWTE